MNDGLISKRHGYVVKKIAKELRKKDDNGTIWVERAWRYGRELWRPYITIIRDNHFTLVEVTCPYETSIRYLNQRSEKKKQKYDQLISLAQPS